MAARPMARMASSELPPMCGVARKLGRREQLGVLGRLGGEHVEGRPGEPAVLQQLLEGRLVDQAAARRVDQQRVRAA